MILVFHADKCFMETITFPAQFSSLASIADAVSQAARTAGLSERAAYAVQLAVDEACSNIIEHGYKGQTDGEIEFRSEKLEDGLRIVLRDQGLAFDPTRAPEPDFSVSLEELQLRGAGLVMMQRAVDELRFQVLPEGINELTLIKRAA